MIKAGTERDDRKIGHVALIVVTSTTLIQFRYVYLSSKERGNKMDSQEVISRGRSGAEGYLTKEGRDGVPRGATPIIRGSLA